MYDTTTSTRVSAGSSDWRTTLRPCERAVSASAGPSHARSGVSGTTTYGTSQPRSTSSVSAATAPGFDPMNTALGGDAVTAAILTSPWANRRRYARRMGAEDPIPRGQRLVVDRDEGNLTVRDPDGSERTYDLGSPEAFSVVGDLFLRVAWDTKYVYSFSWLGRPVIQ